MEGKNCLVDDKMWLYNNNKKRNMQHSQVEGNMDANYIEATCFSGSSIKKNLHRQVCIRNSFLSFSYLV